MKKVVKILFLSFILVFSQSSWAFSETGATLNVDKIKALQESGIITSKPDETIDTNENLTYGAGISMLVKGLGLNLDRFRFIKAPSASDFFVNVTDDAWYADAFIIAFMNGLDIPKNVDPNQVMTREEFAYYLFQSIEVNNHHIYPMFIITIKDQTDISAVYADSIRKLLITKIISLDDQHLFFPKVSITYGDAANWLYEAIAQKTSETPQKNPLSNLRLESKTVNDNIKEVTVLAQAPNSGYRIRISAIVFNGNKAIIYTEPILPDPNKVYTQVVTYVQTITYIGATYEPVLEQSSDDKTLGQSTGKNNAVILESSKTKNILNIGETGMIVLNGNSTTGYSWHYKIENADVAKLVSENVALENAAKDLNIVGAGNTYTWDFKALKTGQTRITFKYYRDWEGEASVKSENIIEYTFDVTPAK